MYCRNICKNYKVHIKGNRHYEMGNRRCNYCDVYMQPQQNNRCPCCHGQLRSKPQKGRDRLYYLQQQMQMQNKTK